MKKVLTTMTAYLLLRFAQITTHCRLSLQQIARKISLNLTSRRPLLELFFSDPPENNEDHPLQNQEFLKLGGNGICISHRWVLKIVFTCRSSQIQWQ